jgi:predicted enzyme related to lactoylglutathione lyase
MRDPRLPNPVVHLELHTGDQQRATDFYAAMCGWRPELIETGPRSYLALETGGTVGGGIVECSTRRSIWLPYVEVRSIEEATERAERLGADVLLSPREGPAGFRSVVVTPASGELALWQPKR